MLKIPVFMRIIRFLLFFHRKIFAGTVGRSRKREKGQQPENMDSVHVPGVASCVFFVMIK